MELLDILDEKGNITGRVGERKKVHEQGLWHTHVGIFIMNKKGELLFQKRSDKKEFNPNKWTRTGGHVDSGEEPLKAAQREAKEEIGVDIPLEKFKLLTIDKKEYYIKEKNRYNRYFLYNYIAIVDYKIEEYKMQVEEVSDLKYMTIDEMKNIKIQNDNNYTFISWDDFEEKIMTLEKKKNELKL